MGVRGGASMRMGVAPPSSAPKSLLAASGESESEVQLPRFDSPCGEKQADLVHQTPRTLGRQFAVHH
jgi:hypothetical protein